MTRTRVDLVVAAALLRVSYHVAQRLVLTGQLDGERIGGKWRVDKTDLERLARERTKQVPAAMDAVS